MPKNGKARRGRSVVRLPVSERRVDLRVRVAPATLARIGKLARSKNISKGKLIDSVLGSMDMTVKTHRLTLSGRRIRSEAEMKRRNCPFPPEPDL